MASVCPCRPEIEFIGLGFKAYKLSPMNSVYKPRNRVLCTRFPFSPRAHHCTYLKNLRLKKNLTQFKTHSLTLIPSHSHSQSQSLSHSHSLAPLPSLSHSVSHSLSLLSLRCRRRRRRCLSLPSLRLRLAQSFSLNGWL